jgi:hypothetical protein
MTQVQKPSCRGPNSCFLRDPRNELCKNLAIIAAEVGIDRRQYNGLYAREGDTLLGYWDTGGAQGRTAIARIIFMIRDGYEPELICYITRVVIIGSADEADLLALYILHELSLEGVGITLSTELGNFKL